MGCPWDRTHGTDRNEREAPVSNEGWNDQWRDITISGETGQ